MPPHFQPDICAALCDQCVLTFYTLVSTYCAFLVTLKDGTVARIQKDYVRAGEGMAVQVGRESSYLRRIVENCDSAASGSVGSGAQHTSQHDVEQHGVDYVTV